MTTKQPRTPGQQLECGWCGKKFDIAPTGRLPKWCSQRCRHLAFEHRRAARADRAPVEVVHQIVTVEKSIVVTRRVEVPVTSAPRRGDWPRLMTDLAGHIDAGRIYDRDLPDLIRALNEVAAAVERRRRPQRW